MAVCPLIYVPSALLSLGSKEVKRRPDLSLLFGICFSPPFQRGQDVETVKIGLKSPHYHTFGQARVHRIQIQKSWHWLCWTNNTIHAHTHTHYKYTATFKPSYWLVLVTLNTSPISVSLSPSQPRPARVVQVKTWQLLTTWANNNSQRSFTPVDF